MDSEFDFLSLADDLLLSQPNSDEAAAIQEAVAYEESSESEDDSSESPPSQHIRGLWGKGLGPGDLTNHDKSSGI